MKKILALLALLLSLNCGAQVSPNAPLLTSSQQTHVKVNVITYAATVNVPLNVATINTITLTGNIALNSTNRPTVSAQGRKVALYLNASGADRTVTFNAAWKVYGTNATSFVIPSGKQAFCVLVATGSAESNVSFAYDNSQ